MASAPITSMTEVPSLPLEFYDKNLLERAKPFITLEKFGQRRPIQNRSGKRIKFRRYEALTPSASLTLTEGVAPTGQQLSVTDVYADLAQYGNFTKITDMVDMTNIDPTITEATDILGEQAGQTVELVIRGLVSGGTNVITATKSSVAGALTLANLQTVVRSLKRNNAKPFTSLVKAGTGVGTAAIRPSYFAYTHPDMQKTLEALTGWIKVENYASQGDVMENEIGSVLGIRFVVSTLAEIATDTGSTTLAGCITSGTKIDVYTTLIFGRDAFGVCPLGGKNFETIIKKDGAMADPLNQCAATVGWKATITGKILNDNWMYRINSGATD